MTASWQLGPILRGMRGHRAAAALVVVQLAVGLALTVLAVLMGDYFARRHQQRADRASGELTVVAVQVAGRSTPAEAAARLASARDAVRAAPGVVAAAEARLRLDLVEPVADELRASPSARPVRAHGVEAGAGTAHAAGLRVRAGRDLVDGDGVAAGARVPALVSAALADALWPGGDALGATFESRARGPSIVVGVIDPLRSPAVGSGDHLVLHAAAAARGTRQVLLVRSEPGRAAEVRAALAARLSQPGQAAEVTSLAEHGRRRAGPVAAVLGVLAVMSAAIVVVILMGSMGLTYFLVARRGREIAVRRALGASRRAVVVQFVVENALTTAAGVALGLAIVLATLPVLAREQEDFVVRWSLVAAATAAVAGLNLLATWLPARLAAAVPPAEASRAT